MTSLDETHVYQREINEGKRTSLSLLAEMVLPGSQVLDVGIGGGALGAFLRDHKGCTVDGITYNTDEALAAGAAYREVKVADLDVTSLSELLGAKRYQYIICADVLEHLRDPGRVLDAARNLLEDGGRLLVSVPNVAYLGLIAELLGGEFRYRREGLLDQTHVRFFTRNSLLRFLADRAWEVQRLESIEVDLADSEFSPALEVLPPAVRSQLLANPDGLSYQFVLEARAVPIGQVIDHAALGVREAQEQAHYVLGVYRAGPGGFEETRKVEARARIAEDQQEVVFWLPTESLHGLRLDPSDRPGFLHLYEIVLRDASGRVLWQWDGSAESLQDGCRQIVATSAWLEARGGALLLAGNDPHVFLPIPASDLAAASGGELCLMLSWPMSADYRVLAERTRAVLEALESTTSALRITTHERNVAQAQASEYEQALKERAASHQAAEAALRSYLSEVEINSRELGRTHEALHAEHVRTRHELIQMADRVSQAQENARRCQSERDDIARHIDAIQNSTVFRLIRPLVRAKICFDSLRVAGVVDKKEKDAALSACTPMSDLVDVIVPVYRGLSDTCCCIESVLAARTQTPFRLVVINDCGPEQVPTGVGFCMYIRRDSLTAVGLFDVENFGKGYGEENDFCIRAYKAGWHHLLTLDTFVRHAGGVSFGDAKTPREREAIDKLRRLHPEYEPLIHAHVAADPARFARLKLDVARMRKLALPAILAVTHSRGGGTERHVHELAEVLRGKALYLALKPMPDGVSELSWAQKGEAFKLGFRLPADFDTLIEVLRSFGVAHVHIHHLIGHDPSVWGIAGRLGVRYDYTVHDYYAVCPQISLTDSTDRYCGELGPEQCRACLQKTPAPGGASIDAWRGNFRQLLTAARFVLLPAGMLQRELHATPTKLICESFRTMTFRKYAQLQRQHRLARGR
ncbi:MAG: methyltransferase domain-containing protein [Uliginosibacterium sp.]|nr:methyltransferase domain-containing protein [Uliginosibacterium sp.]